MARLRTRLIPAAETGEPGLAYRASSTGHERSRKVKDPEYRVLMSTVQPGVVLIEMRDYSEVPQEVVKAIRDDNRYTVEGPDSYGRYRIY